MIYDGRCHRCHCQSSLFIGLLFLDVFLFVDSLSFPPMMIIIAVSSCHSHDDPSHILTTTTHDDDDVLESSCRLLSFSDGAGP